MYLAVVGVGLCAPQVVSVGYAHGCADEAPCAAAALGLEDGAHHAGTGSKNLLSTLPSNTVTAEVQFMSAKQAILERLRAANVQALVPDIEVQTAVKAHSETDAAQATSSTASAADINRFVAALEANHADLVRTSLAGLVDAISTYIKSAGVSRLLVSERSRDWVDTKAAACELVQWKDLGESPVQRLFDDIPAALTTSYGGICETGTLVLWPDAIEPRTVSLVPPLHLVVVAASKLVQNFSQLLTQAELAEGLPTNLLLISGPSKTADIQQTLAYGAHGPRGLVVFLLEN